MFVPKNDPNSIDDIDLMGVYIAPLSHYFGFGNKDVHDKFINEWDVVSYELKKYVKLLLDFNPNVVSLLWVDEEDYVYKNGFGDILRKNRAIFSSKKAYHTFTGYAHGQFKKMTSFNQEALEDIYNREKELLTAGCHFDENNVLVLPAGSTSLLVDKFKQYSDLKKKYFSGYMGEKRKQLVVKYGFDTKNAAHLIRLLRMSVEFLKEGVLNVRRSDSDELLAIKQGKVPLEDVKAEAERLFAKAKEASETSKLPEQADYAKAEELVMQILSLHHQFGVSRHATA